MQDYEKLGLFYLGRRYDLAAGKATQEPVLYDSRDLVTHAVCVGMTGSGKTGLCLSLIEEAAIDGVPVIAIDPKGDIGNLLLTFPRLSAGDFRPWIDEDEARRANVPPDEYAAQQARTWAGGLAEWDQDGARIERLRRSAEFAIYTPGSRAGLPVSVLSSFAAPAAGTEDGEDLAERAGIAATSLLTLAGVDAAPRSREHTLVASLLTTSWRDGRDVDLGALIQQVQTPPFSKIGIVDLESFFPERERFALSMKLNGLIAAPGFEQWMDGAPLEPASLLYTADGRPRVAICSIAHLGDAERMFFVSLLLNQIVGWMRAQTGTSSLRAVVYMDEIAGYFPPVANPPSKPPLLTLLKQGRAFGLGVLLATQNPVDLDYKGLANTGTWFLGRLQTDRDKQRVLDGLEGAAGNSLAGRAGSARPRVAVSGGEGAPPVVPPGIQQFFVPSREISENTPPAHYVPVVLGAARIGFADAKLGVNVTRDVLYAASIADGPVPVDWASATRLDVPVSALRKEAEPGATYAPAPAAALQTRNYKEWEKALSRWLLSSETVELWRHRTSKLTSRGGESERDFRVRVQDTQRAARDEAVEDVRRRYAARQATLTERLRRAEASVTRESEQASQQKVQTAVSLGATLIGALLGKKAVSTGTLGRATTAARGVGRSQKEAEDVKRATETVDAVRAQQQALEEQIETDVRAIAAQFDAGVELERIELAPKRGQVAVQFVALGWSPDAHELTSRTSGPSA
ncbi:MAG: ATP-binding protein [Acidobacteria bacterium]|nr:ATP-binding protein [Acidobacteriota bacterium]